MRGYRSRARLALLVVAGASAVGLASAHASVSSQQSAAGQPIRGDTPPAVAAGSALPLRRHDPTATLRVNVGLAVRNSAALDALIRAARTPGSAKYGQYLTKAQYLARYAPSSANVQLVGSWLRGQGIAVLGASANNLVVRAQGSVSQFQRAFGVTIGDYTANGRVFYSNDRDPTVPSGLNVNWVSGLSNFNVYKPLRSATTCESNPPNTCGFDGGDFRSAYDVVGNGSGQTIGFTLWGRHLPQSDYDGYAAATGETKITVGGPGDDGLDFIDIGGASSISNTDNEVALDTQIAHGVAPGVHETYWLGVDNSDSTLEDVLNAAEASSVKVISNSWGCDGCSTNSTMDNTLQAGAATGQTFYFSSGDSGASVGRSRPADSPYVTAVGGTNLTTDGSGNWSSEDAWSGSGGGCENGYTRPSWQTGIGSPLVWPSTACTGRAEPDVAADAGIGTFLFFDGSETCCTGGTSLAAPIWAAASVIWNKHNAATGRPGIGFSAPLLYALANDPTTYANDFHDITSGSNGFSAGTGWDEVTGWGSPDTNKLANNVPDVTYTGPTNASQGDTITLSATLFDHNASTVLATSALGTLKVSLTAAGAFCDANVDSSGHASCPVTITAGPGHYKAIAAYAGDAAYIGGSQTVDFTVLHIPTKITYTGGITTDYHDKVTLSATLVEDITGNAPIAGRTLTFTLGAESCSAVTDATGSAACSVTPADVPGPYTVIVKFAGDEPLYEPSSTSAAFDLKKEETTAAYTGPTVILAGSSTATLTGTLVEDGANDNDGDGGSPGPVPSELVTLSLGTQSCSAMTDPSGNVSCPIPTVTVPLGQETAAATFAGDAFYLQSSDSKKVIVFAFPSNGAFVLGDNTVAGAGSGTVTWWSDSWSLLDSVSGGPAPASFKGFAGTVTLPTTSPANLCGTTFSTRPGNSAPPTSSVPSYMGVLVASSVTKSGSTINGTWAKIVVVKTDPGYQPNPGHPGTGTIVATFCG